MGGTGGSGVSDLGVGGCGGGDCGVEGEEVLGGG